jgi:hypothetical protein
MTFFRFMKCGALATLLASHLACSGQIGPLTTGSSATAKSTGGNGDGTAVESSGTATNDPGRVVMHRLNFSEYNNTVRDLLHTTIRLPDVFPPDDAAYGFDNVAEVLSLTDVHLSHYQATAAALAKEALSPGHREALVPCDLATEKETCAAKVVASFVPRAWRKPVTADQQMKLVQLFSARVAAGDTTDDAFDRVLQAVLLAPQFLYRIESNVSPSAKSPRQLDGYELASRLSYFIWSSMPDDELFRAAQGQARHRRRRTHPGAAHDARRALGGIHRELRRAMALAAQFGQRGSRSDGVQVFRRGPTQRDASRDALLVS